MITAGSQIVQMAYQGGPDLDGAISRAENLVMGLRQAQRMSDLVPLRTLLDQFWETPGIDSIFAGTIGADPQRASWISTRCSAGSTGRTC